MTQDLVKREDKAVAIYELETRFAMAVRQRELLETYIKERLKPDKHFYTVGDEPGRKPSLTKEGAELICLPHALKGHYEWVSGPENPPLDDVAYQITMKCELEANGNFAGEGIGSASSMVTKRDSTRVQRQKDPGLRHNATIKMACKSAYIAATLNSTAASEFFTQDLEDDHTGSFAKQEATGEHYCPTHKASFFMKGKMKSFAHPIKDKNGKDTGEWCHEHKEKPKTAEVIEHEPQPEPIAEPEHGPPEVVQEDQDESPVTPQQLTKLDAMMNKSDVDLTKLGKYMNKDKGWEVKKLGDLKCWQFNQIMAAFEKGHEQPPPEKLL